MPLMATMVVTYLPQWPRLSCHYGHVIRLVLLAGRCEKASTYLYFFICVISFCLQGPESRVSLNVTADET
jgi:hypothetical protein